MERLDRRLRISPALDASDTAFLAGFARHCGGGVSRIWPGQPAVPSPWVPCVRGCCLVLATSRTRVEAVGQWLRFLITEFLGDRHRLDGCIEVPGPLGRRPVLLIVEQGEVFEGELSEDALSPGSPLPAPARHTPRPVTPPCGGR
jgi:hypothetical protein